MDQSLAGRVAIVTGAARGLGYGIARGLLEADMRVAMVDILESVEESARQLQGDTFPLPGDVSQVQAVRAIVDQVIARWGQIDLLVNNAGIPGPGTTLIETDEEEWDRVLAVNLRGTFLCCRTVAPIMLDQGGGSIINIASIYGKRGEPNNAAYCASKAGIISLTQTLALEAAPTVRVNAICPGHMATVQNWQEIQQWADERGTSFEYERDRLWSGLPLKRHGEEAEIAHTVRFLASDAASYITGQAINVDGGVLFH